MGFNEIALVFAALLPAVALFVYIYKKDRAEKEPIWLLLLLFAAGAISTLPAGQVEAIIIPVLQDLFASESVVKDNVAYLDTAPYYLFTFLENFAGVALVEEGFKLLFLYFITRRSKHFNSLFDGMIYSVVVSLGFAALENIMYAFNYGWTTVLMRMITSVPGHMFFGVLMGYFYSFWNVFRNVDLFEKDAVSRNIIPASRKRINAKRQIFLALLVPVIVHGFYDFCLGIGNTFFLVAFYIFLAGLYIFCFMRVKRFSASDVTYGSLIMTVYLKRNPEVLRQLSAFVGSEELRNSFSAGRIENYKRIINEYYILTYDADSAVETPIEALLEEATHE